MFQTYIAESPFHDRSGEDLALLRAAFADNRGQVSTLMCALADAGGPDAARRAGLRVLADAARHPSPWSRQLLTIRTVQTLTCLDIRNSRRVVTELGGYA